MGVDELLRQVHPIGVVRVERERKELRHALDGLRARSRQGRVDELEAALADVQRQVAGDLPDSAKPQLGQTPV